MFVCFFRVYNPEGISIHMDEEYIEFAFEFVHLSLHCFHYTTNELDPMKWYILLTRCDKNDYYPSQRRG